MDYSDVGYDAFLINGKKEYSSITTQQNERLRVRIINASSSSYFHVSLANIPMKVISLDGSDIKPTLAKDILLAMAETYDLIFEVPDNKSFELKATAQDGTGSTSTWIGEGERVYAPVRKKPDMYMKMMEHSQMDHSSMEHSHGNSNNVISSFTVEDAQAEKKTDFPAQIPRHDVKLVLDGDMQRYIWYINGKAIFQDLTLNIKENEVIRITFVNESMMHHPMHLHGHFFRVINKYGSLSPLKHTVDVEPHATKTIEFYSNEPGEWMLHCHNLYHLNTGMARVVKYSSFTPKKEIQELQKNDPHLLDHLYYRGMIEVATNHAQAQLNLMNTWNELEIKTELRRDFEWEGEGDALYKRWFSKWSYLTTGATLIDREGAGVIGFGYILPLLFKTQAFMDHKGRLRLDINKRFQWTEYFYTDAEFTFRQKQSSEFEVSLMYQRQWDWSAGLMFTANSAGIGLQYNF